jgi:hypothetical protein
MKPRLDEALAAAETVWNFVLSLLPAEVHPNLSKEQ